MSPTLSQLYAYKIEVSSLKSVYFVNWFSGCKNKGISSSVEEFRGG